MDIFSAALSNVINAVNYIGVSTNDVPGITMLSINCVFDANLSDSKNIVSTLYVFHANISFINNAANTISV